MIQAFFNIWRVPDLRKKIIFTMAMLAIYSIGFYIPLPCISQADLAAFAAKSTQGAAGTLISYMSLFTGGTLRQSSIFGLGVMPYISAAIIFQLLATIVPTLKELQKEGPAGQQKIQEWTRYATVGLCVIQASFYIGFMQSRNFVYAVYEGTPTFWFCGHGGMTAGSCFLMWLGEQIDKYGIGNGVSLIITAGIVARMPYAISEIARGFSMSGADTAKPYRLDTVIFLATAFIAVVAGSIIITQGQRRIPVQQAKHTRGRKVYGGQRNYLPLRVNHGGVMPIIFASSLMMFPSVIVSYLREIPALQDSWFINFLYANLQVSSYLYVLFYIGLIYFFSYFWTTVQFQPKDMATQLRDHGSFVPGLRPGPRTAEYLETVMERITYVGAGFLAIIAVIPTVVGASMNIPWTISQFLGGTGLLIVVQVMLDFLQRVDASLLMRNYQGFLGKGGSGRGRRMRGPSGM